MIALVMLSGCLGPNTNTCPGGAICPAGKVCAPNGGCALAEQIAVCSGQGDGTQCTYAGTLGKCMGGVCIGSLCGNGVIDPGELCDGTAGVDLSSGETCSADCTRIYRCGNGVLDPGEGCDCGNGSMLGAGCAGPNADVPNAPCRTNCQLPHCGDGIVDDKGGEECEVGALGGHTCSDFGFYNANGLACGPLCTFDTSGCTGYCGDRILNGTEVCEGKPPPGESCVDFGYESGALGCTAACTPDLSACRKPGWAEMASGLTFPSGLYDVWVRGPADVFAVGPNGTILLYDGQAWSPQSSGTTVTLRAIWGIGGEVWVVGDGGTILYSNGGAWSTTSSSGADLYDIDGTSASFIAAVGASGTLLVWDGTSWSPWGLGTTGTYTGVAVDPADNVVFVTGPDIEEWDTQNIVFTKLQSSTCAKAAVGAPASSTSRDVWFTWCGGAAGTVVHYDGNTLPMEGRSPPTTAYLYDGWFDRSGNGYVTGSGGTVIQWLNGAWQPLVTPTMDGLWGIHGKDADLFVVGGYTILHRDLTRWSLERRIDIDALSPNGLTNAHKGAEVAVAGSGGVVAEWSHGWMNTQLIPSERDVQGAWFDDSTGNVYAVSQTTPPNPTGTWDLLRWSLTSFPQWQTIESGTGVATDLCGGFVSASPDLHVWCDAASSCAVGAAGATCHGTAPTARDLHGVDASDASHMFAVGDAGTIVRWDGAAWTAMESETTADLRGVYTTNPNDAYAAGLGGVVVHWDGLAWSPMASPSQSNITGIAGTGPDDVLAVGDGGYVLHRPRSCTPTELHCSDGEDDDCDGLYDCADPDCSSDATCVTGGSCTGYSTIACNAAPIASTTDGAPSRLSRYGCDPWLETGREVTYRIAPPPGPVTVKLTNLARDLDLVVIAEGGGRGCDPRACVAASSTPGSADESVTFVAAAGQAYYVIVDGYGSNSGSFTLGVSCP